MRSVLKAQPYNPRKLGSFGKASHMLIREHAFPVEYDPQKDMLLSWDHDRIMQQFDHAFECFKKHTGTGEGGLDRWCMHATPEQVLAFLIEIFKADPSVTWTGFRVLGSVNRSSGYPYWTLQLFAKHPESSTRV